MFTDRIQLIACYAVIVGLIALSSWAGIKNYQLGNEVDSQAETIALRDNAIAQSIDDIVALKSDIRLQNAKVDEMEIAAKVAISKAEVAKAEIKPIVETEERRIVGIRSAPRATTCDEIRLKLLKDATL